MAEVISKLDYWKSAMTSSRNTFILVFVRHNCESSKPDTLLDMSKLIVVVGATGNQVSDLTKSIKSFTADSQCRAAQSSGPLRTSLVGGSVALHAISAKLRLKLSQLKVPKSSLLILMTQLPYAQLSLERMPSTV